MMMATRPQTTRAVDRHHFRKIDLRPQQPCSNAISSNVHHKSTIIDPFLKGSNTDRRRSMLLSFGAVILTTLPLRPLHAAQQPSLSLPQTFRSSEGFQFSYPSGWVVAYDRSGGMGDGAIAAVGDFSKFTVVSVFRSVAVPDEVRLNGLSDASGRSLCLDSVASLESTMRFKEIKSELVESSDAMMGKMYDFEYEIEICRGEIQEGAKGVLRCLGGMGQDVPTQKRHFVGRAVLSRQRDHLLTIHAAAPIDSWNENMDKVMRAIVESYRAV